jgi:hypothetical protein
LAAFDRALALAPEDRSALYHSAFALGSGVDGERCGAGAQLDEASNAIAALARLDPNGISDDELLFVLACGHHWRELKEATGRGRNSEMGVALRLTAVAATDGVPAALAALDGAPPEFVRTVRLRLAKYLMWLRLYPLAADVYVRAASTPEADTWVRKRAELCRSAKRFEELKLDDRDPTSVLRRYDAIAFGGDDPARPARLRALFSSDATPPDEDMLRKMNQVRQAWQRLDYSTAALADLQASLSSYVTEGDERVGYRIQRSNPMVTERFTWFVVRENGRPLILAAVGDFAPLGRRALRLIEHGDVAAARRLLDWALEASNGDDRADPFARAPFARAWEGSAGAPVERVRLAALLLAADGPMAAKRELLPRLVAARAALPAGVPPEAIEQAILRAQLGLGQWAPALEVATRLADRQPGSTTLLAARTLALFGLRRPAELRALAEARLAAQPGDVTARRIRARVDEFEQRWETFEAGVRGLIDDGKAGANEYNGLAWSALFHGSVTREALERALRAVQLTKHGSYPVLNTLAMVQLSLGWLPEARATLWEAVAAEGGMLSPSDHLVLGGIAEQLGLRDVAVVEYRQVNEPPDADDVLPASLLAQRRLRALTSPGGNH